MSKNKVQRHYVSPLDQFLSVFDQEHPGLSKSQKKEVEKYRRISCLRDTTERPQKKNKLPEGF
jgi:hypothetical protein